MDEPIMQVYLAGKMAGLTYDEAARDRIYVTEILEKSSIMCRTPMRGKAFLKDLKTMKIDQQAVVGKISSNEIIQRDLKDVDECDVTFILTGGDPSWGTTAEFWYSTFVANKPTVVVVPGGVKSIWLERFATRVVGSVDEGIEVIKSWQHFSFSQGIFDRS